MVRAPTDQNVAEPPAAAQSNVHDAFALARHDRGADVYYIYPSNRGTLEAPHFAFDLYRRAVFVDGTMGPEQQLTAGSMHEPMKPAAARLSSGEILVSFSDIIARGGAEAPWPVDSRLSLFRLQGDAPTR